MQKLKYIGKRTYTGYGITASANTPVIDIENIETANALIASGYFVNDEQSPQNDTPSERWTVTQLKAYADEHAIDIAGIAAKADVLAKILEVITDYSA